MAGDPYVYPGSTVLRNLFGLRDAVELDRRERRYSSARQLILASHPLRGNYGLPHLQAFHRFIFGGVYPWAGEIRSVALTKGSMFALPARIEPYLSERLTQLSRERYLRELPREQFLDRTAYYLAEINSVHPFREGNGRTQRRSRTTSKRTRRDHQWQALTYAATGRIRTGTSRCGSG